MKVVDQSLLRVTPRQRGILDGLADRWGENPWAAPDGHSEPWESTEYQHGRAIGGWLLDLVKREVGAE